MTRTWTAIAVVVALLLVLLGRVIPLPPLVTGEEGVRTQLVDTRARVVDARYAFQQARLDYEHYLGSHDIPNIPEALRKDADDLDNGGDRATVLNRARDQAQQMIALGQTMYRYGKAGDDFFVTLRTYDDQLMEWTRTLGARSEQLRRSTWPILEWLNTYPAPIGYATRIALVPADETSPMVALIAQLPPAAPGALPPAPPVSSTVTLIQRLAPALDAPDASGATIRRLALAGDGLWIDGRYLPEVNLLHDGYFSALRRYDTESLEVAATPEAPLAGRRPIFAWAGAVLVGAVLLGALLLVFAPAGFWRRLPPLPLLRRVPAWGRAH